MSRKENLRKKFLVKRQETVEKKISSIRKDLMNGSNPDKELELKTLIRERESNQLIAKRLEDTDTKLCSKCGGEISEKRLEAQKTDPCIRCAQKEERQQRELGIIPSHCGYGCESQL